jgi:hypothetical protein
VDVPGVTVDGDQVVHRRLGAGRQGVGSRGHGLLDVAAKLAALVDGPGLVGVEGVARP